MSDGDQMIDPKDIEALTAGLLTGLDAELAVVNARADEARLTLERCEAERCDIARKRETILQAQAMQLDFLKRLKPTAPRLSPWPPIPQPPTIFAGGEDVAPLPSPSPVSPLAPSYAVRSNGGSGQDAVNPLDRPGPQPSPPSWVTNRSKTRARIGPQRFFILTDIRENGPTGIEKISERTGLSLKRVKDQVRSDINEGMLDEVPVFTDQPAGGASMLRLSNAGGDLLRRFIEYRNANNQALPTKEEALGQLVANGENE